MDITSFYTLADCSLLLYMVLRHHNMHKRLWLYILYLNEENAESDLLFDYFDLFVLKLILLYI